jgi:threonine synthase
MDVGDPSNMERLMSLYPGAGTLAARLRATSIDDAAIRASIAAEFARTGFAPCPHTAAGLAAYRSLPEAVRRRGHWVVAATAHAAKFPEIVEPLVGRRVEPPPSLAALLGRTVRRRHIDAGLDALVEQLEEAACTP